MDIHKPKPMHNWREFLYEIKELQSRMELASMLLIRGGDMVHAPVPLAEVREDLRVDKKSFGSCIYDPAKTLSVVRRMYLGETGTFQAMGLATPDLQ